MRAIDLSPAGLAMGAISDVDHDLGALASQGVWLVQWPDGQSPPAPGSRYVDGVFLAPLPPPLAELRARKIDAFQARTAEFLALGFEWPPSSGLRCGMVDDSSGSWATEMIGAMLAVTAGTAPPRWTHLDGSRFGFADASEFQAFYVAAFSARAAIQESAADLIASALAATDQTSLDLAIDQR